jgi:hypothetical protein
VPEISLFGEERLTDWEVGKGKFLIFLPLFGIHFPIKKRRRRGIKRSLSISLFFRSIPEKTGE